ncbi:integumentary mucin C.1-like [Hydra vulgaris]|uniref:Integumentary mucin C.1-like n=1 Tax=Hydra vulgaris TaxID=6087 RepID=A0ABM4B2R6_HYDVU
MLTFLVNTILCYITVRLTPKKDCAVESTARNISNVTDVDFTISENDMFEASFSKDTEPNYDISCLSNNDVHSASTESTVILSPEDLRPFKKAELRKRVRVNKRNRTTSILTDSTNMNVLKIEKESAKKKKSAIEERKQANMSNKDNIKMSKRSTSKGSIHLMEKSLNCPNSSVEKKSATATIVIKETTRTTTTAKKPTTATAQPTPPPPTTAATSIAKTQTTAITKPTSPSPPLPTTTTTPKTPTAATTPPSPTTTTPTTPLTTTTSTPTTLTTPLTTTTTTPTTPTIPQATTTTTAKTSTKIAIATTTIRPETPTKITILVLLFYTLT